MADELTSNVHVANDDAKVSIFEIPIAFINHHFTALTIAAIVVVATWTWRTLRSGLWLLVAACVTVAIMQFGVRTALPPFPDSTPPTYSTR